MESSIITASTNDTTTVDVVVPQTRQSAQPEQDQWTSCPGCGSKFKAHMQHDCLKALGRRISKLNAAMKEQKAENDRLRETMESFMVHYLRTTNSGAVQPKIDIKGTKALKDSEPKSDE